MATSSTTISVPRAWIEVFNIETASCLCRGASPWNGLRYSVELKKRRSVGEDAALYIYLWFLFDPADPRGVT